MTAALTLTAPEVAELFGTAPSVIYERVRAGEIPNVGVGSTVRIPRPWVDERLGVPAATTVFDDLPEGGLQRLAAIARSVAALTLEPLDRELAALLELAVARSPWAGSAGRGERGAAELKSTATRGEVSTENTRVSGRVAPASRRRHLEPATPPL